MLDLFYDYSCPFCYRAHAYIKAYAKEHPELKIRWLPTEAHPRPEVYASHSDLLCQAMFFARDAGVDLWALHDALYEAVHIKRIDVENTEAIAASISHLVDEKALITALEMGTYKQENLDTNALAYEQSGVWALPAYRQGARRLDSAEGIGVTEAQVIDFLKAGTVHD